MNKILKELKQESFNGYSIITYTTMIVTILVIWILVECL